MTCRIKCEAYNTVVFQYFIIFKINFRLLMKRKRSISVSACTIYDTITKCKSAELHYFSLILLNDFGIAMPLTF